MNNSRPSSIQLDERRPLAIVDTDTTDYYDDLGGIPPPHRLSGLYSNANNSASGHFSPSQSAVFQERQVASDPFQSYYNNNHGMNNDYSAAGAPPPMQATHSYASYGTENHAAKVVGGAGGGYPDEESAYLNAGPGGMSPAVAARERYMARKEANGSPYGYGQVTPTQGKRGCFAGKRKWAWIVGAITLIAAVVGVAVGVSRKSSSSSKSGVSGVVQSDGNDPSKFSKDARLHQSFYGMCYTPLNSQYPACGDTLDAVIEDVQLMSQLTSRLRLYGSDCQVSSLVLEAIEKTKVNMTVFLAAWVPQPADDPDNSTWTRQMNAVLDAIKTYGVDHVEGVSVGNEYLLNNGPEAQLLEKVSQMRSELQKLNLPKTIPVGTADAGSMITTQLAQGCDFVMANVHAWFGGLPVAQAADWVYSYTANQEPASALKASNSPKLYIAETGWPTNANSSAFMSYQGAQAGIAELNTYLDTYVCQANANITAGGQFSTYFHFEMFDEPWKAIYGGVEPYWGLFNSNKTLKEGVVIPDCAHP